jgi:hypothetical protein
MLSRPFAAGLLILALGPALEVARAQQTPATTTTAATSTTKTTTKPAAKSRKHSKKAPVEPVVEAPPPPPPTPEQSPAGNPLVSYQNGQLTIHSENSTLGSILNAIKTSTGASVDGPGVNSPDRVATQIGPGDPREVLTTLLNSSKYDFILVGPPGSPNSVQKIILTARVSGGPGGSAPQVPVAVQTPQPAQSFQPPPQEPDQELPDAEIPDDANQPEMPPPTEPTQDQQPPNGMPGQVENGQPGNPNQPKSPEQLLQELQRMQQQQQQIQQQQPQDR